MTRRQCCHNRADTAARRMRHLVLSVHRSVFTVNTCTGCHLSWRLSAFPIMHFDTASMLTTRDRRRPKYSLVSSMKSITNPHPEISFPSCQGDYFCCFCFVTATRSTFYCSRVVARCLDGRSPPLDGNRLKMESRRLPLSNLRVHNFSIGPMT